MSFTEVKAPEQLRFENPGDSVEGILVAITSHTVKGKPAVQYTLARKDGTKVTFLATWDLAQKIDRQMLGYPVSVRFERYHESIERNGNRAKVFAVMIDWDAKPSMAVDSLEVGDEDIPF